MRDKKRIHEILNDIEVIWEHFPDLRLGQLLCNTLNFTGLYYIEDVQLVSLLSKFYNLTLSELKEDTKIIDGGVRGSKNIASIGAANKGKVYIHKDSDIKLIDKSDLDVYLNNGYSLGRKDK